MLLSYLEANRIEAGCDEAGRGCLAGSVYAAAVILPPDFHNEDLKETLCTPSDYRAGGDCLGCWYRYA